MLALQGGMTHFSRLRGLEGTCKFEIFRSIDLAVPVMHQGLISHSGP